MTLHLHAVHYIQRLLSTAAELCTKLLSQSEHGAKMIQTPAEQDGLGLVFVIGIVHITYTCICIPRKCVKLSIERVQ